MAASRPMPLPAPVMMATLPSNKVDEAALPPPARCLFTTAILLPCDIVCRFVVVVVVALFGSGKSEL